MTTIVDEDGPRYQMEVLGSSISSFSRLDQDDESDGYDDGVALVGSRNAKWWYSTYHNVTAIVGAGVLGLPTTMVYLGWGGGTVVLVVSWFITLFTLWQMVQMHELENGKGGFDRIDTYYHLGQRAFGPKLGLWIMIPQQIVVQVGSTIVYMLTGGEALWNAYQLILCKDINPVAVGAGDQCCGKLGRTTFTVLFALFQLVFAQLRDFNSIASISLLASVTSICYCTIAWVDAIHLGNTNHSPFADDSQQMAVCPTSYRISHNSSDFPHFSGPDQIFGVFSALGVIAFAYAGHNVVLEIQATLPSTREHPSKIRMWRGVVVAYIFVGFCYFPVAFAGYWAFGTYLAVRGNSPGNPRGGNILLQLGEPRGLIATANFFVAIHVTGSYQVYAMPMFQLIEKVLVNRFRFRPTRASTSMMRIVIRSTYVFFTAFMAFTFPFFSDLLAFVGGFALTPTTFFFPCVIWLRLKNPRAFSISWLMNWILIVVGVLLAVFATIGGLRNVIVDSDTESRVVLWQRVATFAVEVALSSVTIMGTLLAFTFSFQREFLHAMLPDFLYYTMGTIVLIMIETAIPVVFLIHNRHQTIHEKLFLDVLQLQSVTVARASPQELQWIEQQREIQVQAQASRRQSMIRTVPAVLIDPETMSNHPKIKYYLTLPLNFIPIFGQALFCWLNAMETATSLHHYYYSNLKGLSAEDEATIIHSRKKEYIEFGLVASALTLLPGLNIILILTNAIGAALWVADIERAIQRQE